MPKSCCPDVVEGLVGGGELMAASTESQVRVAVSEVLVLKILQRTDSLQLSSHTGAGGFSRFLLNLHAHRRIMSGILTPTARGLRVTLERPASSHTCIPGNFCYSTFAEYQSVLLDAASEASPYQTMSTEIYIYIEIFRVLINF